jgi:chromosome segregation ATPase
VNWARVRSVLEEVRNELASAQKETIILQSSMHRPQTPIHRVNSWELLLSDYKAQRDEQLQRADQLLNERDSAPAERIAQIDAQLQAIELQLNETNDSITSIEARIGH